MSDYSTIKSRALQLLGDPDGVRYDDATLQESLRQALSAYTRSCPQIRSQVLTLAADGREHSLEELATPPLFLLEVIHPYLNGSTDTRRSRPPCTLAYVDGTAWLRFPLESTPQAGEQVRVGYAAAHTLAGLDDAEITSIPASHEAMLALGAAVFAALQRVHQTAGSYGIKEAEPNRLRELASSYLERFNLALLSLRTVQSLQGFPAGFKLDEWD